MKNSQTILGNIMNWIGFYIKSKWIVKKSKTIFISAFVVFFSFRFANSFCITNLWIIFNLTEGIRHCEVDLMKCSNSAYCLCLFLRKQISFFLSFVISSNLSFTHIVSQYATDKIYRLNIIKLLLIINHDARYLFSFAQKQSRKLCAGTHTMVFSHAVEIRL